MKHAKTRQTKQRKTKLNKRKIKTCKKCKKSMKICKKYKCKSRKKDESVVIKKEVIRLNYYWKLIMNL